MTFENILDGLTFNRIDTQKAYDEISAKDKMKVINYYLHFNEISKEPMTPAQLQQLNAIVGILQILYNSDKDSPVSDSDYDVLQETLVDMGIPRLTGSIEINSSTKVNHKFTQLRGTLDKIYYLSSDEKRTNKSRKYLDEWIKSAEVRYEKNTGVRINLDDIKVMITPKFDGGSCILEVDDKMRWITRGDTGANLASDVSHIMDAFNDMYRDEPIGTGVKFEVMIPEDSKDRINQLCRSKPYHNSRQIVTATLNSNEPDYKVDFLYPVPLRIIHDGDQVEQIHPDLIRDFPTEVCYLHERDKIRAFANRNRYVEHNGHRFRTDGAVLTILDPGIQAALGRENNINKFEVAYKFTEEYAYSRVKDIIFEVSDFGYLCPILLVNDVILKGNTVRRISLSNKERFDELDLAYGDEVKVMYDIIPYATIDQHCKRMKNRRKIEFVTKCPRCGAPLDLDVVQVRCPNRNCPSRIIGRIQNYCSNLRIQNIGFSTLDALYKEGFLNDGIRSLYKLKKHSYEIEGMDGFGRTKAKKIIAEIEAKRRLNDYEFFGAIGIDSMSTKTFQTIFKNISVAEFMSLVDGKAYKDIEARLLLINGIGPATVKIFIEFIKDTTEMKMLNKLLKEVTLIPTYGAAATQGRVTFSGCRPNDAAVKYLKGIGYDASDSWSNKDTKYLVIPHTGYQSSKVATAMSKGIPIIALDDMDIISALKNTISRAG